MTTTAQKKSRKGFPAFLAMLATRRFWTEKWFLIPAIAVFLAGLMLVFGLDLLNPGTDGGGALLTAEHTELVQDPVCGSWVDPQETPFKTSYMGYDFYFCSQECLDKFRSNPLAYLRMKLRINVGMRKGESPSTEVDTEPPPGPDLPIAAAVPRKAPPRRVAATTPPVRKPAPARAARLTTTPKPAPPKSAPPASPAIAPATPASPAQTEPPSRTAATEPPTRMSSNDGYSPSDDEKRKDFLARQLVDHLYITGSQMPVQDMMVELDNFKPSKEPPANSKLGPNLILSSSDKLFFKSPYKLRIDAVVNMPGGAGDRGLRVIIRDGTHRWLFVPQAQYPVKKGVDEPSPTMALPFNTQRYPSTESNKLYAIVGRETVGGVTSEVVRIVDMVNKDDITTVWIDKSRWVPVKVERNGQGKDNKPVKKRVMYKDVRTLADGRNMPFLLEVYENEGLVSVYEYKKVAVNVGLQASLFLPMEKFIR